MIRGGIRGCDESDAGRDGGDALHHVGAAETRGSPASRRWVNDMAGTTMLLALRYAALDLRELVSLTTRSRKAL